MLSFYLNDMKNKSSRVFKKMKIKLESNLLHFKDWTAWMECFKRFRYMTHFFHHFAKISRCCIDYKSRVTLILDSQLNQKWHPAVEGRNRIMSPSRKLAFRGGVKFNGRFALSCHDYILTVFYTFYHSGICNRTATIRQIGNRRWGEVYSAVSGKWEEIFHTSDAIKYDWDLW